MRRSQNTSEFRSTGSLIRRAILTVPLLAGAIALSACGNTTLDRGVSGAGIGAGAGAAVGAIFGAAVVLMLVLQQIPITEKIAAPRPKTGRHR